MSEGGVMTRKATRTQTVLRITDVLRVRLDRGDALSLARFLECREVCKELRGRR